MGHEVGIKLRTIYFDRKFENSANDRKQGAFEFEANYLTPTLANWFRVGLSAYVVEELDASGRRMIDVLMTNEAGDVMSMVLTYSGRFL